jgi:hypothetical protein
MSNTGSEDLLMKMAADFADLKGAMGEMVVLQRDIGQSAADASKKGREGFEGFGSTIMKVVGAAGGLSIISQVMNANIASLERAATAGKTAAEALGAALGATGELAAYGDIRKQLEGMQGVPGLSLGERAGLYRTVRGAIPGADRGRVMALTQKAGRWAEPVGMEGGTEFAGILSEMARIKPGATPEELSNLTAGLVTEAGKYGGLFDTQAAKGIQQLIAEGATPDEAIEIALAAMQSGQGARGIAGVAGYRASVRQAQEAAAKERGKGGRHKYAAARDVAMPPGVKAVLDQVGRRDYAGVRAGFQTGGIYEAALGGAMTDPLLASNEAANAARQQVEDQRRGRMTEAQMIQQGEAYLEYALTERGVSPGRREELLGRVGLPIVGPIGYKQVSSWGFSPETSIKMSAPPSMRDEIAEGWKTYQKAGGEMSFKEALDKNAASFKGRENWLDEWVRKNKEALDKNTEALKENSRATMGNSRVTGGAANPNAGVE